MQRQNNKPIYNFNWGDLKAHYNFLPRVMYKEVILSKAKWIVKKNEIIFLNKINKNELLKDFLEWRASRDIPRYVSWINFDNTLLFDFETQIGIRLFLKSIQNREEITLEEFVFAEKSVVQNSKGDNFCNQIILSFYKEQV